MWSVLMFNSQQKRGAMQTLFGLLLTAVNSALFALVWFMYYRTKMYIYPFFIKGDVIVVLLFALLFYMFAHLYSGFDVVFQTAAEMMYSNTVAAVISCGIMYVITALLIRAVPNVLPMLVLVVGCVAMSGLLSFCVKKATARFLPPRATLLVYGNPEARKEGEDILRRLPGAFYVLDSISADVGSEELCRQIFRWDARAVMLCGVPSSERNDLLKYCIDRNIEAYVRPNIGDLLVKGARAMQLDNLPVLVCHRSSPAIWYLALKRLTDILLSLAALVVFSPFMLITAIAIKLYDGGPILYKQLRLTKDGKQFQEAYLSGYLADKYNVDSVEAQPRANERVKKGMEQLLRNTLVGYDTVTTQSSSMRLETGEIRYAMLPVWILSTKYRGKVYKFAMNAQTGKFVGELPVSWSKFWGIFALITGIVTVLGTVLQIFM